MDIGADYGFKQQFSLNGLEPAQIHGCEVRWPVPGCNDWGERANPLAGSGRALAYVEQRASFDRLIAALLVILLLVPATLIALLIRCESRGPVLFRQQRRGKHGIAFQILKFRTMRAEKEAAETCAPCMLAMITQKNDPRITRLGALLRRTRLDELPQLINVLRGEMSLVGPRPEALVLADFYAPKIADYALRYCVRPGMSGLAQIRQGHVTSPSEISEKLGHDLYYLANASLRLDLKIILQTILVMISGRGAK